MNWHEHFTEGVEFSLYSELMHGCPFLQCFECHRLRAKTAGRRPLRCPLYKLQWPGQLQMISQVCVDRLGRSSSLGKLSGFKDALKRCESIVELHGSFVGLPYVNSSHFSTEDRHYNTSIFVVWIWRCKIRSIFHGIVSKSTYSQQHSYLIQLSTVVTEGSLFARSCRELAADNDDLVLCMVKLGELLRLEAG